VIPQIMNKQKTALMLVAAFVLTAGVVVTALSIVAPSTQAACSGERDTKSCPNKRLCVIRLEEGKKVTECTG
jgi:hypothetical protein